jgi:hypothetical protein
MQNEVSLILILRQQLTCKARLGGDKLVTVERPLSRIIRKQNKENMIQKLRLYSAKEEEEEHARSRKKKRRKRKSCCCCWKDYQKTVEKFEHDCLVGWQEEE